jgi:hypothetical protein
MCENGTTIDSGRHDRESLGRQRVNCGRQPRIRHVAPCPVSLAGLDGRTRRATLGLVARTRALGQHHGEAAAASAGRQCAAGAAWCDSESDRGSRWQVAVTAAVCLPGGQPSSCCFSAAAAENFAARLAAIWIVLPLAELRPSRAARSLTLNLPRPAIATSRPAASSSAIASHAASTALFGLLAGQVAARRDLLRELVLGHLMLPACVRDATGCFATSARRGKTCVMDQPRTACSIVALEHGRRRMAKEGRTEGLTKSRQPKRSAPLRPPV